MAEKSLKHYGVLGMKWGLRKYQNPDGSLTAAGKKRYGENGKYEYKSHGTKNTERALKDTNAKIKEKKKVGEDTKILERRVEKLNNRLKANKIADKNYVEYAKNTSAGKALAQGILFGPFGARGYQQARANGEGRFASAILGIFSTSAVGNMAVRGVNRTLAKGYSKGRNKVDMVGDSIYDAGKKIKKKVGEKLAAD